MSADPGAWLERVTPDRLFLLTADGKRYTYGDLLEASGRIAANLQRSYGVMPGERVAVRVEKSPETVCLYVACLRLGAVFVPVNTAYSLPEVEYFLTDAQPRVTVVEEAETSVLQGRWEVVTLAALLRPGIERVSSRDDTRGTITPPRKLSPDMLGAIVYTSGTTGRFKGAMLTRGNLASNAETLARSWRFSRDDVLLHVLPLFHVHGLFAAINTVLASGSSMILLSSKFDAAEAVRRFGHATVFMGVPTHYTRLLQEPSLNRESTARMRLFVSGSAPLLAETHQEFSRRTGHQILERYGMTETLMNTSNPYEGARVPGSVGPPLPGIQVRVRVLSALPTEANTASGISSEWDSATNPQAGKVETTPEVIGTLEIRGPNVFAGYWQAPEKTAEAFTPDGWFQTGDLGKIDSNGYVHIVGRVKDLVISGGYNVYPKEVESELDAVPGVLESAVFGVSHPDFGEAVTAAVVLEDGAQLTEEEILEAVRSRLARYKLPKRVLLLHELPRNAMGKVQKNILRVTNGSLYVK